MSLYAKLVAVFILAAVVVGGLWKSHVSGIEVGRAQVEAEIAKQEREVIAETDKKQQVITKTVTKLVEKAAQDRVVYRDIIKEVETYVPRDLAALPSDFRVFHDAAAEGRPLPSADDPARVNAFPVLPKTVATTLAENYAECRYDQQRLEALQEVVRTIQGETNGDSKKDDQNFR